MANAARHESLGLALASENHVYTFSKPEALANVEPRYTPEVLAEVRRRLRSRSDAQLCRGKGLDAIYADKTGPSYRGYRDAAAHVLLERGILCGHGDWIPTLWVDLER